MKSFKFGLQRLLELREQHEMACSQDLAAAQRSHGEALEALRSLDDRIRSGREQQRRLQQGVLAMHEVTACGVYLDALQRMRILQEQVIEQASQRAEQARLRLLEAGSARKAVEKLRTRSHDAWHLASMKVEMNFLDEMSSLRYNRKLSG